MTTLADVDWNNWQAKDIATLLFIEQDEQLLLIRKKRGLGQGKINGPGGKLDPGETPEQCAIREIQEELCVTASALRFCGEHLFEFLDGYRLHVHVFHSHHFTGTPTETDEAIPLWTPKDQIPFSEMWADDELWFPFMLNDTLFKGHYLFDDDVLLDYDIIAGDTRLTPQPSSIPSVTTN